MKFFLIITILSSLGFAETDGLDDTYSLLKTVEGTYSNEFDGTFSTGKASGSCENFQVNVGSPDFEHRKKVNVVFQKQVSGETLVFGFGYDPVAVEISRQGDDTRIVLVDESNWRRGDVGGTWDVSSTVYSKGRYSAEIVIGKDGKLQSLLLSSVVLRAKSPIGTFSHELYKNSVRCQRRSEH